MRDTYVYGEGETTLLLSTYIYLGGFTRHVTDGERVHIQDGRDLYTAMFLSRSAHGRRDSVCTCGCGTVYRLPREGARDGEMCRVSERERAWRDVQTARCADGEMGRCITWRDLFGETETHACTMVRVSQVAHTNN